MVVMILQQCSSLVLTQRVIWLMFWAFTVALSSLICTMALRMVAHASFTSATVCGNSRNSHRRTGQLHPRLWVWSHKRSRSYLGVVEDPAWDLAVTTTQAEHQVKRRLLLDVVVSKGAAIFELLAREDEALLVGRDAFLVLDLGLDHVDGVRGLHLEGDGLAREGFHEDSAHRTRASASTAHAPAACACRKPFGARMHAPPPQRRAALRGLGGEDHHGEAHGRTHSARTAALPSDGPHCEARQQTMRRLARGRGARMIASASTAACAARRGNAPPATAATPLAPAPRARSVTRARGGALLHRVALEQWKWRTLSYCRGNVPTNTTRT